MQARLNFSFGFMPLLFCCSPNSHCSKFISVVGTPTPIPPQQSYRKLIIFSHLRTRTFHIFTLTLRHFRVGSSSRPFPVCFTQIFCTALSLCRCNLTFRSFQLTHQMYFPFMHIPIWHSVSYQTLICLSWFMLSYNEHAHVYFLESVSLARSRRLTATAMKRDQNGRLLREQIIQ